MKLLILVISIFAGTNALAESACKLTHETVSNHYGKFGDINPPNAAEQEQYPIELWSAMKKCGGYTYGRYIQVKQNRKSQVETFGPFDFRKMSSKLTHLPEIPACSQIVVSRDRSKIYCGFVFYSDSSILDFVGIVLSGQNFSKVSEFSYGGPFTLFDPYKFSESGESLIGHELDASGQHTPTALVTFNIAQKTASKIPYNEYQIATSHKLWSVADKFSVLGPLYDVPQSQAVAASGTLIRKGAGVRTSLIFDLRNSKVYFHLAPAFYPLHFSADGNFAVAIQPRDFGCVDSIDRGDCGTRFTVTRYDFDTGSVKVIYESSSDVRFRQLGNWDWAKPYLSKLDEVNRLVTVPIDVNSCGGATSCAPVRMIQIPIQR